jgi:hypothetical protein
MLANSSPGWVICDGLTTCLLTARLGTRYDSATGSRRRQVKRLLARNPGLRNPAILAEAPESAWDDGRDWAIRETGLDPDRFPSEPIFDLAECLDEAR